MVRVVLLLLFSVVLIFQPKLDLPNLHSWPFWGPYLTLSLQSNLQHIWDCHVSFPLRDDIYSVNVLLALQKQVCMSLEYTSTSCCIHCSKHTNILQLFFFAKVLASVKRPSLRFIPPFDLHYSSFFQTKVSFLFSTLLCKGIRRAHWQLFIFTMQNTDFHNHICVVLGAKPFSPVAYS